MSAEGPPPEAYERVTNPQRYALLHEVVARVSERLCDEFDVERDDSPSLPTHLGDLIRAVRLVPAAGGAAMTLVCTPFPGVKAIFGEWRTAAYPVCGCDACDEDPRLLAEQLETDVLSVVRGNFTEYRNRKGKTGYRIERIDDEGYRNGSQTSIPRGRLKEHRWPAWTRR